MARVDVMGGHYAVSGVLSVNEVFTTPLKVLLCTGKSFRAAWIGASRIAQDAGRAGLDQVTIGPAGVIVRIQGWDELSNPSCEMA